MEFLGRKYAYREYDGDLLEWCATSKVGEYTVFYVEYIFHTEDGFYAAYQHNLNNYKKI